jgi:NAD(P)-dependent dehydrogenase (short-subunit alcohol dehydrogenase family)/acyl carrier protein
MATVLGPCGVIPKEFPNVKCFNVDLPDNQAIDNLPDEMVAAILSEFAGPHQSQVIAYRGRYRWERRYEQVKLPKVVLLGTPNERTEIRRLRRGGVYLITGGTGGLGLAFAKYLAKTCRARIVLTKRTAFPEKSKWKDLLNSKEAPEAIITTIRELLEIERLGAEVEVFVAEASDQEQMRGVVNETLKRFHAINGVIHAAGSIRPRLIKTMTKEMADSVLSPKVHGTMVLFDLLRGANLDFMVLLSSMSSVIGPYAHADYSAANCFLDAFANYSNSLAKFHTLTINWPVWKEVGVGARSTYFAELEALLGVEDLQDEMLKRAILTNDGLEAFKRALNSDLKQVMVSPESLDHLLEQSRAPFDPATYLSRIQDGRRTLPRHGIQKDGSDQLSNEVETALGEIWSSVFGLERIGIHELFSHLGGNSLLAMQIVSKIRSLYQISFTLREFFEAPTIAQLSSVIEARILAEIESLTDDQARQLVSHPVTALVAPRRRVTRRSSAPL